MTREEAVQAARTAIGAGSQDDYIIQPTRHAEQLEAKAPVLAALLRRSEFAVLAREYERKDEEANRNQALFKSTASRANWAVLLTACFSALLLVTGTLAAVAPGFSGKAVLVALGVCGVLCGGLGSMWLFRARQGGLLEAWMSARAAAEALRAQYFEAVASAEPAGAVSEIPLALLQLEYFRRYQFDVQMAFYEKRSGEHRRDADHLLQISAAAAALASVGAGLAAFLGLLDAAWVSIAVLGTVGTALSSFASTKEAIGQSRRNSSSYAKARDALALLARRIDQIRTAAADGERETLRQFVAAVHDQLSAEHRQWLAASQSIQPALETLDAALAKLNLKPPEQARAQSATQQ